MVFNQKQLESLHNFDLILSHRHTYATPAKDSIP